MAKKKIAEKIKCTGNCGRELTLTNFYNSKSPMFANGKAPLCKKCIKEKINYDDIETVYDILRSLDIPFIYDVWYSTLDKKPNDVFGNYMRQTNSLPQYDGYRYRDSLFEPKVMDENTVIRSGNSQIITLETRERLLYKWGNYPDDELLAFERKFDLLKNNYPQKTAMHTEALQNYIRYRVKEELATARNDVAEAQKWGTLADKASERAKINPSQLSKADLSGGLNGFGELSRAVEKAVDIIEILPKFKEKPCDVVDFTLLCYINYVRRLKNLPDAEYKDIYHFYEERKEEYKKNDKDREFKFKDEK